MDFGTSADDYARYRAGFPASFFERTPLGGLVLDLGSGTGSIAAGLVARGARAIALDVSHAMLRRAPVRWRLAATAEALPIADARVDAVTAGQCWHWFERERAAREAYRVLRPGGSVVIAHFDYVPGTGGVAFETERLILERNPAWPYAGSDGLHDRWQPDLEDAGFRDVRSTWWDEPVRYSHEAWRGRIRACNGVIALRDSERIAAFDAELGRRLVSFPDPVTVPHRVFVLRGWRRP